MVIFIHIIYVLLSAHVHTVVPGSVNVYPVYGSHEVYDVLLTDGEIRLGLVRVRKQADEYCVVVKDVMKTLGYMHHIDEQECLSVVETHHKYGVPLTLQISKMELAIERGYNYPAKDYRMAMERVNKADVDPLQNERSIRGYKHSILPETRRVDLTVWSQSQRLHTPDIQATITGDAIGGLFSISGQAAKHATIERYYIPRGDYNWLWIPNTVKMMSPHIEVGSNLSHQNIALSHSVRLSNKPRYSRMLPLSDYIRLDAPIGSIVEWAHHSGDKGRSVVGNSELMGIHTRLGYGLNKLTYSITKPGEVTTYKEQWIRVPYKMISRGRLEYQTTYGAVEMSKNASVVSTMVDYGLRNRLSVGFDHTILVSTGTVKDRYSASMVWAPTYTTDFYGRWSSDSNYLVTASFWVPQYGSLEISDLRYQSFVDQYSRPSRRQSTVRAIFNGNRIVRYQLGYTRTEYNNATTSTFESNTNMSLHRWLLSTHIAYRWWDNLGVLSTYRTDINWNLGYRFRNRLIVASDVYTGISERIEFQSFRISAYYNTSSYQFGGNITSQTPFNDLSLGFFARIATDRLTMSTRNEIYGGQLHGSHVVSTSWMKSRKSEWHPSSQTSGGSCGIALIPFHDKNGNGIKDSNEEELSGLIGSIKEGHMIALPNAPDKLIFGGLQPYRKYEITLEANLRNDPDYMVLSTRIHVDTPGSGFRSIQVPVIAAAEIDGRWELADGSTTRPGYNDLLLTKTDGSHSVRGILFSDGTWIIDKIGTGSYAIQISSDGMNSFVASPKVLHVVLNKASIYPLITITSQS